jgi:hypothetical protein
VIPTLALDIPTNFFLGSLWTLLAARQIRARGGKALGRTLWLAIGYAAWFAAVVAWPMFRYPDWMFVYLDDPRRYSLPAVYAALAASIIAAAACGQLATQWLVRRGRTGSAALVSLSGLFLWAALFAATWDQYWHIARYADFLAGRAPRLFDVPQAVASLNAMGALLVVPALALAVGLLLERRRLTRAASAPADARQPR